MFALNVRFQIASLIFMFIIIFTYIRTTKLSLLSTKFFSLYVFSATLYLFADIATVYTITHMDTVPGYINRLAHQAFIIALECCIVGLFLYVAILGKNQKRFSKFRMALLLLPFAISIVIAICGPLYYFNNGKIAYSYGPMVVGVYVTIVTYLLMTMVATFYYRNVLPAKTTISVRIAIIVWIVFAAVQFTYPGLLISSIGIVAMVLFLYLSFENPKEHIDQDIGCFNKRAFHLIISEDVNAGKPFRVVNIVIENFTDINKYFGRNMGNQLLENAYVTIKKFHGDKIYRSHTNSLTFITDSDDKNLLAYCEYLNTLFNQPFHIQNYNVSAKAHMDIIEVPKFAKTEDEIYDIIKYMAEQTNMDQFVRSVNANYIQKMERVSQIEKMLYKAIDTDGFRVQYQPIFSTKDMHFISAEALVRLKDTDTIGYVSPEEFIPIAEQMGIILKIGAIVFEKVCMFMKENQVKNLGIHYIEINLSSLQCMDTNLPEQLNEIMKKYNINPESINLEITETAWVESGKLLQNNIDKLKEFGCSFSMDDFGTGYSNLSQMADVSYDIVKIDKSLLWRCFEADNTKAVLILQNVIGMLKDINIKIVVEGVETEEQAQWLTELGVDYFQGYLYSKPINEQDYIMFLNKNHQ